MSSDFPVYSKINSIQKRFTEGSDKGQFTGEWALDEFDYLQDNEWIWREKVDGTNIRIKLVADNISGWPYSTVGGRTDNAQIPGTLLTRLRDLFDTDDAKDRIRETFEEDSLRIGVVLYGEGYGKGIQKGGNYGDPDFILFDVNIEGTWLQERAVTEIACALGINRVPLVGRGTLLEGIDLVRQGKLVSAWPNVQPEGLVMVPATPLFDRRGHRIITKVKAKDFR